MYIKIDIGNGAHTAFFIFANPEGSVEFFPEENFHLIRPKDKHELCKSLEDQGYKIKFKKVPELSTLN